MQQALDWAEKDRVWELPPIWVQDLRLPQMAAAEKIRVR